MITDDAIRVALINEHKFYSHDMDLPMSLDDFTNYVATLNREQLLHETCTDEFYSLDEFIDSYGD